MNGFSFKHLDFNKKAALGIQLKIKIKNPKIN